MYAIAQKVHHDQLLRTIESANKPGNYLNVPDPQRNERCKSGRSRASSASRRSRASSASKRAGASRPPSRSASEKAAEEENKKRQKYWEKWAAVAAKALLAQTKEETPSKELLYNANIGCTMERNGSEKSLNTNLSLLSCSSGTSTVRQITKTKKASPVDRTDWVTLAKERKSTSLLSRLLKQSNMGVGEYEKGGRSTNYAIHGDMSDLMDEEEQEKLYHCGVSSGLRMPNGVKSSSTHNILTLLPGYTRHRHNKRRSFVKGGKFPLIMEHRTPSPQEIAREYARDERPLSAAVIQSQRSTQRDSAPNTPGGSSIFTSEQTHGRRVSKHSIPSLKRSMSKRLFSKIRKTAEALDRATGWGDSTDTCREITDESVTYTATDYAMIPKYPQEIRIAPVLSKTIKEDIRHRMGRPRQHEIRTKDVKEFDNDNPDLDRSHRNLLIFNWLITMDDVEYDMSAMPDIYDLDNEEPVRPDTHHLLFPSVDEEWMETPGFPSPGVTRSEMTSHDQQPEKQQQGDPRNAEWDSDCSSEPDPRFNYY